METDKIFIKSYIRNKPIIYDKIARIGDKNYALLCQKDRLGNTPDSYFAPVCVLCDFNWYSSDCRWFREINKSLPQNMCGTYFHPMHLSLFELEYFKKYGELRKLK